MTGILITLFEIKNIPKLKRVKRFNKAGGFCLKDNKKLNIILLRFKFINQDVKHSAYVYNLASHFILAEETGQVNLSKVETSLDLTVCKYLKG